MRGISIFQKLHYREFRTMRGRPMRGLPVIAMFGLKAKIDVFEKKFPASGVNFFLKMSIVCSLAFEL